MLIHARPPVAAARSSNVPNPEGAREAEGPRPGPLKGAGAAAVHCGGRPISPRASTGYTEMLAAFREWAMASVDSGKPPVTQMRFLRPGMDAAWFAIADNALNVMLARSMFSSCAVIPLVNSIKLSINGSP